MAVGKMFTSAGLFSYLLMYSMIVVNGNCPDTTWTLSGTSCYKADCTLVGGGTAVDTQCGVLATDAKGASITSATENNAAVMAVASACGGATDFWMGLADGDTTATDCADSAADACEHWKWSDSRPAPVVSSGYENFATGQDGTADAVDCGFFKNTGVWELAACATQKTSICRVAATTTTTTTPGPGGSSGKSACLSGDDEIVTEKAGTLMIKHLAPGDKVMSMNDAGEIIYDEIFLITHASPDYRALFTSINVANITLHLTDKHMIIVDGIEKSADQVKPNDKIYFYNKFTGNMMIDEVESVGNQEITGIYNPVTKGGRLLVNGVMTSAYPRVYQPITAGVMHNALWGIRMLYNVIPDVINAGYNVGDGMPVWVKYAVSVLDRMTA